MMTTFGEEETEVYNSLRRLEFVLNNRTESFTNKVESLIEVWKQVSQCRLTEHKQYVVHLMDWLKLHTLNIVLTGDWKKLKDTYEERLLKEVKHCEMLLLHSNNIFSLRCRKLAEVIKDPWGSPVLGRLLNNPEVDIGPEEIEFFGMETGYLISTRLRKLCESHCEDLALNLVTAFMRCHQLSEAQHFTLNATEDQRRFILDVYIALLYKYKKTSLIISTLKSLTLTEGLDLLKRFAHKRVNISKIWRHSSRIAHLAAQVYVTAAVMKLPKESGHVLEGLLDTWLFLNESNDNWATLTTAVRRIIQAADSAIHMYIFCEAFYKKFGSFMKTFIIELYIRALTTDMNDLERQKNEDDTEKVAEISERLAYGFLRLADVLNEHLKVSRECVLTSFSLKPTLTTLDRIITLAKASGYEVLDTGQSWKCKLHPPIDLSDEVCYKCDECGEFMSQLELKSPLNTNTALSEALTEEQLGLSPQLCDDLVVVLSSPRYQLLNWLVKWKDLHRLCVLYLDDPERTKNIVTELKFVDIDYSIFATVKREPEDEEANGIERGYEHYLEDLYPDPNGSSDEAFPQESTVTNDIAQESFHLLPPPVPRSDPKVLKSLRQFRPNLKRSNSKLSQKDCVIPPKVFVTSVSSLLPMPSVHNPMYEHHGNARMLNNVATHRPVKASTPLFSYPTTQNANWHSYRSSSFVQDSRFRSTPTCTYMPVTGNTSPKDVALNLSMKDSSSGPIDLSKCTQTVEELHKKLSVAHAVNNYLRNKNVFGNKPVLHTYSNKNSNRSKCNNNTEKVMGTTCQQYYNTSYERDNQMEMYDNSTRPQVVLNQFSENVRDFVTNNVVAVKSNPDNSIQNEVCIPDKMEILGNGSSFMTFDSPVQTSEFGVDESIGSDDVFDVNYDSNNKFARESECSQPLDEDSVAIDNNSEPVEPDNNTENSECLEEPYDEDEDVSNPEYSEPGDEDNESVTTDNKISIELCDYEKLIDNEIAVSNETKMSKNGALGVVTSKVGSDITDDDEQSCSSIPNFETDHTSSDSLEQFSNDNSLENSNCGFDDGLRTVPIFSITKSYFQISAMHYDEFPGFNDPPECESETTFSLEENTSKNVNPPASSGADDKDNHCNTTFSCGDESVNGSENNTSTTLRTDADDEQTHSAYSQTEQDCGSNYIATESEDEEELVENQDLHSAPQSVHEEHEDDSDILPESISNQSLEKLSSIDEERSSKSNEMLSPTPTQSSEQEISNAESELISPINNTTKESGDFEMQSATSYENNTTSSISTKENSVSDTPLESNEEIPVHDTDSLFREDVITRSDSTTRDGIIESFSESAHSIVIENKIPSRGDICFLRGISLPFDNKIQNFEDDINIKALGEDIQSFKLRITKYSKTKLCDLSVEMSNGEDCDQVSDDASSSFSYETIQTKSERKFFNNRKKARRCLSSTSERSLLSVAEGIKNISLSPRKVKIREKNKNELIDLVKKYKLKELRVVLYRLTGPDNSDKKDCIKYDEPRVHKQKSKSGPKKIIKKSENMTKEKSKVKTRIHKSKNESKPWPLQDISPKVNRYNDEKSIVVKQDKCSGDLKTDLNAMNPCVVLKRLEFDKDKRKSTNSVLAQVPGLNDLQMIRPSSVDRIVQVVQVPGSRPTTNVPIPNTQTSTQVTPHIQRIGQPRAEKPVSSDTETAVISTSTASSTSSTSTTTESPTLINILSQQIIRPANQNNCVNVKPRTSPLINILSQQIIKPASTASSTKITTGTTDTQVNSIPRVISGGDQIISQLINQVRTPAPTLKTLVSAPGPEQNRILQFICKSSDGKLIPVTSFTSNKVVKVSMTQTVNASVAGTVGVEENNSKVAQNTFKTKTETTEGLDMLPKFQHAFGKPIYQNNVESSESSGSNSESINTDAEKSSNVKSQPKNSPASLNVQPVQGGVIYTRQVPVGQTINLIPPGRGQVFRIATTNPEQLSLVKDSVIQGKMSALLAAALQGKQRTLENNEVDINSEDESPTSTRVTLTTRQPLVQNARIVKPVLQIPSNVIRSTPQSNLSSTTLEQLREFDMVYKQVKERSSTNVPTESSPQSDSNDTPQQISVTYLNQSQKINCAPVVVVSSYCNVQPAASPSLSVTSQGSSSPCVTPAPTLALSSKAPTKSPKAKTIKSTTTHTTKASPIPKPQQKPQEDEHTTQRIFDILAEYAEQLRNSPDLNNKPAPRRRSNPPTNPNQNAKRKKSSSTKKTGQSSNSLASDGDLDDTHTVGSEDSSCGVVQISVQDDEQPLATVNTSESSEASASPKQLILTDSTPNQSHSLIIADSNVGEALKMSNTAVLVPGNYIMPVSMVKGGQQIAVVSGGSKILATVPARSGPNMLLFQSFLNQTRKHGIPTVKYSTIQPISGITRSISGVNTQTSTNVPVTTTQNLTAVTLSSTVGLQNVKQFERVEVNNFDATEVFLAIPQAHETKATSEQQQNDHSTITTSSVTQTLQVDNDVSKPDSSFDEDRKEITNSSVATSVIAQTTVVKEEIREIQPSTTPQTIMALNLNSSESDKDATIKVEGRVQSVLVTTGTSNGPMLSHNPPTYNKQVHSLNSISESNKDEYLRNEGKVLRVLSHIDGQSLLFNQHIFSTVVAEDCIL